MRVYSEDDLDRAKAHFESAQLPAAWVEVPHQGRTLHVLDAVGTPLEFCASMATRPRLVVQFQHPRGACPQRLDHFQILVPEVERACEFYCALGFRLSEFVAADGTDDLMFVFLQRKGNPHDIVFANGACSAPGSISSVRSAPYGRACTQSVCTFRSPSSRWAI